ncbi:MAG: DNA polymerase III subunit alpha [bacterium]|nr:DNA polymerase III subunit alpha [bacterium]
MSLSSSGTKTLPDDFVHLHNHSDYSLLDGAMKASVMAKRAADLGQKALALTDHGNMFGAVEFYQACRKNKIKPIIGTEAYITADRFNRKADKVNNKAYHLVLLAKNEVGYRNLCKLSSKGYMEGFYYRPRIDHELLSEHSEGIIGLSACMSGEPNFHLRSGNVKKATDVANQYKEILGADNYFLEIQNHGIEEETRIRELMPQVAKNTGLGIVATNDCHFLDRSHHEAHDILMAIQTGNLLNDPNRWRSNTPEIYFKDTQEMLQLFQDWPQAVENTLRIADMVDFEMQLGNLLLPIFELPEPFKTADEYVEHIARQGINERYPAMTEELETRLQYELGIIKTTGYAGYFLIVWDFIDAARNMNIPVGPGRGSAAGSLVCYGMGITDIDPIRHQLLFERFLNPERVSMPDIDVDFCYERRSDVIEYVAKKYGQENVSQIITFGTMAARAVLKDVARTLDFSFAESDRISKLVPEEVGITLKKAIDEAPGLKDLPKESDDHALLLRNALVLEGMNRNTGIHAAGVLITPSPLIEHAPMYKNNKGDITVQFDMNRSEELGLLKMDFLGLRTLTVIDKALKLIADSTGKLIKAEEIPTDDPITFKLFQEGRTVGIFQLESSGMQELVRKMAPTCYDDITAICALYRPGPLGADMDKVYVERKHGREKVTYKDDCLEPILKDTYGVILYQEQVMQIASKMGGFTMGMADSLRKAMGKKKLDMMAEMKIEFMEGAKKGGYNLQNAADIYEEMEFFAQYGFNKSHSAAYALLSIQTAWLKAHHPAEFMAATMSTEMRKSDRITQLIDAVKALDIKINPPDINKPSKEFGVQDGEILFGMGAVKGVGSAAIDVIRDCWQELGRPFTDLFDLCENVDLKKVNRKVLEGLINAGAMDSLPGHRHQLLQNIGKALAFGQKAARDKAGGQASLFGGGAAAEMLKPSLDKCEPFDPLTRLSKERASVGFFLSGHPFEEYRELIGSLETGTTAGAHRRGENTWVNLVGVLTSHTKHRDRHKRVYARGNFEDKTGVMGLVIYNKAYDQYTELVESDSILVIGGRVQVRGDEQREVVVDRITRIDEVLGTWVVDILVEMDLEKAGSAGVAQLGELFDEYGDPCEMRILGGELAVEAEEEEAKKEMERVSHDGCSVQGALGGDIGGGTASAPQSAGPVPIDPSKTTDKEAPPEEFASEMTMDPSQDPELMPDPVLARPVPLVIEVKRQERTWLLKSGGRNLALTLDSLRQLRQLPGIGKIHLRANLPGAIERKKRFFGRG